VRSAHHTKGNVSDEGEVSLKEVKDTVSKQMVELKAAISQRKKLLQAALKIHGGVFQAQRSCLELEKS